MKSATQIDTKWDQELTTIWSEQGYFLKSNFVNIIFRVLSIFDILILLEGEKVGEVFLVKHVGLQSDRNLRHFESICGCNPTPPFPEVQDEDGSVRGWSSDLVTVAVPANLIDAVSPFVWVNQLSGLCAPDMNTLVEWAAGQELAVGRESHQVDGFLVLDQGMKTQLSRSMLQTLRVMLSEQLARNFPWRSHLMAFTSLVCPWNDLTGLSETRRQAWMHLSVEQDAKLSSGAIIYLSLRLISFCRICLSLIWSGAGVNILSKRKS